MVPSMERTAHRLDQGLRLLSSALGLAAGLCLVALLLYATANVASRQVLGNSLAGIVDRGQLLLVMCAFLSLAYAYRSDAHITIGTAIDRIPPRAAAALEAIGLLVTAAMFAWLTWESTAQALSSYDRGETTFGLERMSVWPARASIALGAAALTVELVGTLVRRVAVVVGRADDGAPRTRDGTPERPSDEGD